LKDFAGLENLSVKKKQQVLLQLQLEQSYDLNTKYLLGDSNENVRRTKLKDNDKLLLQVQKQILEMAKLLNSHFLYPCQLELKKLKCDFIGRGQNQVMLMEIVSYETMPLQPVFEN